MAGMDLCRILQLSSGEAYPVLRLTDPVAAKRELVASRRVTDRATLNILGLRWF